MHIGYLTTEFPGITSHSGGIGTSIQNLAQKLVQKGHKVSVYIISNSPDNVQEKNGLRIVYINKIDKFKTINAYLTRKKTAQILKRDILHEKLNIIESPDWAGLSAFIKLPIPIVVRMHGSDTYFCHLENRKQKFKNYYLEKKALKKADFLLSVSQFTAKTTKKLFGLKKSVEVIHNGINTSEFEIIQKKKTNNLIYFGSLVRKKGVLEIPHIFNKVVEQNPHVKLFILGKDVPDIVSGSPSTWELMEKKFSKKARERVNYLGAIPYKEIKTFLANSSIAVLPSFAEAFPMSWLEAMAAGVPIVGSNMEWSNEVITDGFSGYLIDPKNHELYAEKILLLLADDDLFHEFSRNAINIVKNNFDSDIIAQKNLNFYSKILK